METMWLHCLGLCTSQHNCVTSGQQWVIHHTNKCMSSFNDAAHYTIITKQFDFKHTLSTNKPIGNSRMFTLDFPSMWLPSHGVTYRGLENGLTSHYTWCEAIIVTVIKSSIFWNKTPCNLLKINWLFGGTCHLPPQGWRISQASSKQKLFGSLSGPAE
jgi:hypothetical protein